MVKTATPVVAHIHHSLGDWATTEEVSLEV